MLFVKNSIQGCIVPALAEAGTLGAVELHDIVVETSGPCSPQAIYKALATLLDTGVVVKHQQRYSLSVKWCLELVAFADSILDTSLSAPCLGQMLPPGKLPVQWNFDSLFRLNHFWCHLILSLVRASRAREVFSWNPHPWFYLARSIQETDYLETLNSLESRLYKVVGGTTFLDRWAAQFWNRDFIDFRFEPCFSQKWPDVWLNVIGDYVLIVELDRETRQIIDEIYSTVQNESEMSTAKFSKIFNRKAIATIEVSRDETRAIEIRDHFRSLFVNSKSCSRELPNI